MRLLSAVNAICVCLAKLAALTGSTNMQSILQILKVNDLRSGTKDGRAWEMQDAECILLDDTGQPSQVGVLPLPKDLRSKAAPGVFFGTFGLRPNLQTRKIEAVLTGLQPMPPDYFKRSAAAGGASK